MDNIFFGFILLLITYPIAIKTTNGRLARFEYNTKLFILFIIFIPIIILFFFIFYDKNINEKIKILLLIFLIISFVILYFINLRLLIRRFFDIGKPTIYIFATLIPLFGLIILIISIFSESQEGINEYDESINYKNIFKENLSKLNIIKEYGVDILIINNIKLFVKNENYKFTIMMNTENAYILHNDIRSLSKNIIIKETKKFIYYKNIIKYEFIKWINNYMAKNPNVA